MESYTLIVESDDNSSIHAIIRLEFLKCESNILLKKPKKEKMRNFNRWKKIPQNSAHTLIRTQSTLSLNANSCLKIWTKFCSTFSRNSNSNKLYTTFLPHEMNSMFI